MLDRYDFGMIRTLRKKKNMTIQQLAELSGLTYPTVISIETSKTFPSLTSLDQIAEALGLSTTSLLLLCQKLIAQKSPARIVQEKDTQPGTLFEGSRLATHGEIKIFRVKGRRGMETDPNIVHGDVYELNYVLHGTVEIIINKKTYWVEQDETLFFHGLVEHYHRFLTDGEIISIHIPKDQISMHSVLGNHLFDKTETP